MHSIDVAGKGTMVLADGFLELRWRTGETILADEARTALSAIGVNLCWWTPEVAGSLDSAGRCSCEHDTT